MVSNKGKLPSAPAVIFILVTAFITVRNLRIVRINVSAFPLLKFHQLNVCAVMPKANEVLSGSLSFVA